jgi:hypothetical protein
MICIFDAADGIDSINRIKLLFFLQRIKAALLLEEALTFHRFPS